jgi:formylglycine-generating enzyme required for sulfatase activity
MGIPGSVLTMRMVAVKGGAFRMSEKTKTANIRVSDFWIGAYEVTHDQFAVFFQDDGFTQGSKVDAVTRPTPQYIDLSWGMGKEGGYPVNSMSQDAALMFCRWLYGKTGVFHRLPTEAEWEYACRAGSKTAVPTGMDPKALDAYAWHARNSKGRYQKVGQRKPNAWGLYDMLGNLAEWTLDQYVPDYLGAIGDSAVDPVVPPKSRYPRSVRGGSYVDAPERLRATQRTGSDLSWNKRDPQVPKSRWWLTDGMFVGFRVVRPRIQPTPEEAEKFYTLYLGR